MSANSCLPLLLDSPMQSWGFASRFNRRTTALHPTRSGVFGMIAAALGIDKHGENEADTIARFAKVRLTVVSLPRRDPRGRDRLIQRLEDYHTVTGIRRASGKVDDDATVLTSRHYLLDARFGVLLDGNPPLIEEIEAALSNPKWGVWFGRKCCVPATPVLVAKSCERLEAWRLLLQRTGYSGDESLDYFDHVIEVAADESGAEFLEDAPLGYGHPIGERHTARWIQRIPKSR